MSENKKSVKRTKKSKNIIPTKIAIHEIADAVLFSIDPFCFLKNKETKPITSNKKGKDIRNPSNVNGLKLKYGSFLKTKMA